jgi:hypothetical protein
VFRRGYDTILAYVRTHQVRTAFISGIVGGVLSNVIASAIWAVFIAVWFRAESTADIERLIADEARLAREAPLAVDAYVDMFSPDAQIVDVQNNGVFKGRKDIADRFLRLPKFNTLVHDLLAAPTIHGDSATAATLSTIEFEQERHAANEIWMFVRVDSRWKIHMLRFNNPR